MLRRLGVVAGQSTDIPPSAPTINSITPGNGSLSVNFTAPESDGGRVITNYEFSTNNGSTWTTRSPASTASPIVITGLNNGTNYTVLIRAVNLEGPGDSSNSVVAKPYTVPTAPQNVIVSNTGGGTTAPGFTISFTAPFSNGGDTITNYEYTINGGSTWTARSPASTTSPITISGVVNNQTYSVGVRAVNAAGGGASVITATRRPLPHFTSVSASTPAVSTYPYTTNQSSTYRTVTWSADPIDTFSAGSWRVRLLDGATVVATKGPYTSTALKDDDPFTISYANSAYWKTLTVSFEITDSSSQTTSASTTVAIPAAETSSQTIWSTASDTYNGSFGTTGIQGTGFNKQSGEVPSSIYTAARAWDNNNGTQFRVDNMGDVSGERYVETYASFNVYESILGTLVASDAQTAGPIINSSSMSITRVRFRTGIRNSTHFLIYDVHGSQFRGTGATAPPAGALLEGQATAYYIQSESVIQDGATWNTSGNFSIGLTRAGANPYYNFNISVVQRRADPGRVILTDAQYDFSISYSKRVSSSQAIYR